MCNSSWLNQKGIFWLRFGDESGSRALNNIIGSFTLCLSLGCIFLCLASTSAKPSLKGKKRWPPAAPHIHPGSSAAPAKYTRVSHPRVPVKVSQWFPHWLGLDPTAIFWFSLTPADISSRHHTDCKLGRGHPDGKSKCCSPKKKERMLEKTSCGLLYHPSWPTFLKVLPMNITSEDVGLAHTAHLEVIKGIFNATPNSLWRHILQGKGTHCSTFYFGRPQLGLETALHGRGRFLRTP